MYIYISPNFVFLEILSNLNFNTFHKQPQNNDFTLQIYLLCLT